MQSFFAWLFGLIILFSLQHLTTSVHGFLLADVAINCGYVTNSTALDGRHWVGESPLLQPTYGKSTSSVTAHKLLSADPTPYLTARLSFSYFSYLFQVTPGQKFVRLHFYPESYHEGFENSQDRFTVEANSFTLLHNFSASLAADVLGVKYVVKEYCLNVNETGILQITFFALQRNFFAFVNGIEIISMPTDLYYTPDDKLGPRIVGQNNRFHYVDNSTALELVTRLNVGGSTISTVDDPGLFRRWVGNVDYLQESDVLQFNQIEYAVLTPSLAPPKIYQTSRKLRRNLQLEEHFTWKVPVDLGFSYLLRLHFSFVEIEILEGGIEHFNILVQNLVVEPRVNVIQFNGGGGGGNRIPMHRDYMIFLKGDKGGCKRDLRITLQPFDELVLGLLKGIEIFKLSNPDNSLAGPNPSSPIHTYPSRTLKISTSLVAFGLQHVIMALLTLFLALVNCGVYGFTRICGHTFWPEKNVESVTNEPSCHRFSLAQILLATENFNDDLVIGKGGFGKVYKGTISGRPEILAIKRLKPGSKQGAREFWREIDSLSQLRHVNLVSLLGYSMEGDEMALVYEYMSRGTIADNIYKYDKDGNERIPLTWVQRLRICIDAARGLDYLHTGTQHGIIHRDVKDTNILLDENLVAKISDFGLSKLGKIGETQGEVSTNVKGTFGYLDPDYLMTHKPSTKSDVYAFGIVLLVVLSGRPAVVRRFFEEPKCLLDCYRECVTKGDMNEIIDPFLQGDILNDSLTRFMKAVGNCLHDCPKKRLTMAQLVVHLEHALEKQLGSVPSMNDDSIVIGRNSVARSNQPSEICEIQVAPMSEESIISPQREGNNGNREIQKHLWGKPWVSLRNILKPNKKMDAFKHPVHMFSLKEIKSATKDFSDLCLIGRGTCGVVYKGFINDDTKIVAIKRFTSSVKGTTEWFHAEVELLSRINHVNFVSFEGICTENDELIIVYEYMAHGTLGDHIYGSKHKETCLTWEQRLKICIGAARGLNYLHDAGFIHREVVGHSIMFKDEDYVAKVSDLLMCKQASLSESEIHVSSSVVGIRGYIDPRYEFDGRLSKASDVYSFGILLLVVLSGSMTFNSRYRYIKIWYKTCSRNGQLAELIDPKFVEGIPSASFRKYLKLVKKCIHEDPKRRPVMAQVVVNLEKSLDRVTAAAQNENILPTRLLGQD